MDKVAVHEAQGELFSKLWLQLETTSFKVCFGINFSNSALVVMFMQPCEIHSVLKPQDFLISKFGRDELMRDWYAAQHDSDELGGGRNELVRWR